MKRKIITRGLAFLMAFAVLFGALPPVLARAELIDISDNEIIISKTVPKGKTGKRMTVNFTVRNNTEEDWQDVEVNIYNGSSYIACGYGQETVLKKRIPACHGQGRSAGGILRGAD